MDGIKEIKMRWLRKGDRIPIGLAFEFEQNSAVFTDPPQIRVLVIPANRKPTEVEFSRALSVAFDHGQPFTDLQAEAHQVGEAEGGFLRMVYNYAGHESGLPVRAGLTVHAGKGGWSSWPPHGFEQETLRSPGEVNFVEKFAYVSLPPGRWGIQVRVGKFPAPEPVVMAASSIYAPMTEGDRGFVDDIVLVKDRDVLPIPAGSHPTAAGPGTRWAYFWAYSAEFDLPEKFGEEGWE